MPLPIHSYLRGRSLIAATRVARAASRIADACRCSVSGVELDGWDESEHRGGQAMARCTVEWLMHARGLCGTSRGDRWAVEPERRAPMSAVVACLGFTRGRRRHRRRTRRAARRRAGLRAVSRPRHPARVCAARRSR